MRIALVAGETSGDMLGAGLIAELKKRYPQAQFEGIGGPLMQAQGMDSFVPMERLSVMGLVEVLGRIFELIKIRRNLIQHWQANPPDVFIGIDAPDFNLGLEETLRKFGIKTVHYVSPSVWMWRQKRVFKIARAVDLMLTLFPFEAQFYQDHQVPVAFVGHHLADKIPLTTPKAPACNALGLDAQRPVVCLMPGSRAGEVAKLGELFLQTAQELRRHNAQLQFVIPCANAARQAQIRTQLQAYADLPVTLIDGQSHQCMAAADVILLASGTATLEAMLMKRPMVVSYRMSSLTFAILKRMVSRPWVSLPNLLANKELVPELLQQDATVAKLSQAVLKRLDDETEKAHLAQEFMALHLSLKCDADAKAAQAVAALLP
ncbi:MAG: hypothetical protein RL217_491 [Pseudomonadota bacterium]|jgi:lipid-A-disaccharide synthase